MQISQNDPYARHAAFVAVARDAAELPRTLAGVALVVFAFLLAPALAGFLPVEREQIEDFAKGDTPGAVILQLAMFGVPVVALGILTRRLHGRRVTSLLGSPVVLADLKRAFLGVVMVTLALEVLPPWLVAEWIEQVRPIAPWLMMAVVALPFIVLQAGAEELFFRGYLQQQLAVRWRSPLIWMVVPSAIFGASHYFNAMGPAEGVLWALWATMIGIAAADLTARSGSIGAAVGLHVANNAHALLLYGYHDGETSGLALVLLTPVDPELRMRGLEALADPMVIFEFLYILLIVGVMWLAARVAIRL